MPVAVLCICTLDPATPLCAGVLWSSSAQTLVFCSGWRTDHDFRSKLDENILAKGENCFRKSGCQVSDSGGSAHVALDPLKRALVVVAARCRSPASNAFLSSDTATSSGRGGEVTQPKMHCFCTSQESSWPLFLLWLCQQGYGEKLQKSWVTFSHAPVAGGTTKVTTVLLQCQGSAMCEPNPVGSAATEGKKGPRCPGINGLV